MLTEEKLSTYLAARKERTGCEGKVCIACRVGKLVDANQQMDDIARRYLHEIFLIAALNQPGPGSAETMARNLLPTIRDILTYGLTAGIELTEAEQLERFCS